MKRIVRLTESDLSRIVRRVISEQEESAPLKIKLITPQGMATDLKLEKDENYGYKVDGNICEFFQVYKQGRGQDVYKTEIVVENITKTGIRLIDVDVSSIEVDIYPQVTQKLLGPGQKKSFFIEVTPANLDEERVVFHIRYKSPSEAEKGKFITFSIVNNIDECAVS